MIFAGVLHRAVHDLAAATVGQQRDLLVPITRGQIEQVRRSEVAHSIYQALSRGSCRIVEAGEARPMRVWLPHYDEGVIELIQQAMPGVRIQAWRPLPAPRTSLREAAEALAVYLVNLPSDEGRVSLRKLKKETGLSRCSPSTFQRAREKALMMLPGWRRVKGSLVRRESDF